MRVQTSIEIIFIKVKKQHIGIEIIFIKVKKQHIGIKLSITSKVATVGTRGESPPSFCNGLGTIYSVLSKEGPLILLPKYGFRV